MTLQAVTGWLLAVLLLAGSGLVAPARSLAQDMTPVPAAQPVPVPVLSTLLPPASAVPVPNAETVDGTQDLFTIAATFPDAAIAMRNLQQWGFQGNAWRDYVSTWWENPYLPVRAEVSLHQFRTAAGAEAALPVYANGRIAALGLAAASKRPVGEHSLLLTGAVEEGTEDTIYVAVNGILARITVVSPQGDPYPTAKKIARSLVKTILGGSVAQSPAASSAPVATAIPTGNIAVPAGAGGAIPATGGNVAVSNPPAAPASSANPALDGMLADLRDTDFTVEKVGEDICCLTFAEATTLGLTGEIGTLYFRGQASGYISHLTPSLRYTIFDTPESAATAWNQWVGDRKEYLAFKEFENPADGEPPVVIFTAEPNDDTATSTGFLLVDNVVITASVRSSDWQALLPSIAQRNTNSLLLAGYRHLIALFGA
jgi:hypothetical protein